MKTVLDRAAGEAGVEIFFETLITGARTRDGRIESISVSNISGNMDIGADVFVDATGNADLTAFSGFGYHLGRPEDGKCQPMTLFFRLDDVD